MTGFTVAFDSHYVGGNICIAEKSLRSVFVCLFVSGSPLSNEVCKARQCIGSVTHTLYFNQKKKSKIVTFDRQLTDASIFKTILLETRGYFSCLKLAKHGSLRSLTLTKLQRKVTIFTPLVDQWGLNP